MRANLGWVAISMLVGDRVKFFSLIFGVAFATLLMAQQISFCIGLISLSGNAVRDIPEADLWVMRRGTQSVNTPVAMPLSEVSRVKSVSGVAWAVPLLRGAGAVRIADGSSQPVGLVGVDDATLLGAPQKFFLGRFEDLRGPDAVFLNRSGYKLLFPGEPEALGRSFELNDRRAVVAGIVDTLPVFGVSRAVVFTRYANALRYAPSGRNALSFILVKAAAGQDMAELAQRIDANTGLKATTRSAFVRQSIDYTIATSGIVYSFAVVVILGAIVGAVIVALTLSLFVRDNLRQLGALKAIGVRSSVLVQMVLMQALLAALIGFGLGIGATAWVLQALAGAAADFSTFYLPWQVMVGVGAAVLVMTLGASLASVRKVVVTDAAVVFRG